jgi:hydroxyacylglutathione hydrolase
MPVTISPFEVDHVLAGEMTLEVGGLSFSLRHVPGHSPDSLCFHLPAEGVLFGGDTVFAGSIGRTDLPGGEPAIFREAIRAGILSLPEETVIYPGHGPRTTVGREAASNPFLS